MRKQSFLSLLFLFLTLAFYGQSNLPNGGMELWDTITQGGVTFEQIQGPFFSTLNELSAIAPPIGPGPTTTYKVSDCHSGKWAAKLVSKNFVMIPTDVFIPGLIGSTTLLLTAGTIKLGKPCAGCKPTRFTGWYKFEQVNGDSCAVALVATRWNNTLHKKDTIGFAKQVFTQPVSAYTEFDLTVDYPITGEEPDSLLVLCVSSGGFSVTNLQGSIGQIGNTMFIDDLSIEYPQGITQVLMPEVGVKTYPNPARDHMVVELSQRMPNATFEIYTMDGKFLSSCPLTDLTTQVPVNSLESGKYYYQLMEGKTIQNTGFFMVLK